MRTLTRSMPASSFLACSYAFAPAEGERYSTHVRVSPSRPRVSVRTDTGTPWRESAFTYSWTCWTAFCVWGGTPLPLDRSSIVKARGPDCCGDAATDREEGALDLGAVVTLAGV